MSDVIIAIVPAPGHEGLVADGPYGERPGLLIEARCVTCGKPTWIRRCCPPSPGGYALRFSNHSRGALVLYAPGGPRLGMVRAMEALEVTDCWCIPDLRSEEWRVFTGTPDCDEGVRQPNMPRPPAEVVGAGWSVYRAFAAAHLLHQRGLASEVLVLPVPS